MQRHKQNTTCQKARKFIVFFTTQIVDYNMPVSFVAKLGTFFVKHSRC